jgi:hypothetical protein
VSVTFSEVLVRQEGGKWVSLPLAQTDMTVDLMEQHPDGSTALTEEATLEPGEYDKIRLVMVGSSVQTDGPVRPAKIAPEDRRLEKDFSFQVEEGERVDLTVYFNLGQSLMEENSLWESSDLLSPGFNVVKTDEAATIHGEIAPSTFQDHGFEKAVVTVFMDKDFSGDLSSDDGEYASVAVDGTRGAFTIHWLVPERGYTVSVELNGMPPSEYQEFAYPADVPKGGYFELNKGAPI